MAVRNARPGMLLDPGNPINSGLVGWWPMWEGAGGKCLDIAGKNNHGTLTNDPVWADGLKFDGTDDYVGLGVGTFNGQTQGSITATITPQSVASFPIFAVGENDNASTLSIWWLRVVDFSGTSYLQVFERQSDNFVRGNTPIVAGRTYNVAVTSNNSTWKLYVDGLLQTLTTGGTGNTNNGNWWDHLTGTPLEYQIGRIPRGADNVGLATGIIKNLRLWSRTLSAQEALQLHLNPDHGLWVPDTKRYYVAAAGGFQPAWAANSNVILGGAMSI